MRNVLKILGIIFIIYIVVFACNKSISNNLENEINVSPVMEKVKAIREIEEVAKVMNSKMPISIDEQTTAVNAFYSSKHNELIFYYQITDMTGQDLSKLLNEFKYEQINYIKNNPNNGAYLRAKVNFKYVYSDKDGKELGNYTINFNEYL